MAIQNFISQHKLPSVFESVAVQFYSRLGEWIRQKKGEGPIVIGVNGAQGSGKSTLADYLKHYLQENYQWNTAILSIDDLYLTQHERKIKSESVHPLFATRGVPGTHDVKLGLDVLHRLKKLDADEVVAVPKFSKLIDDRLPDSKWERVKGPVDLILFEGWCVGSVPQYQSELTEPINDLEKEKDIDGRWRQTVNDYLTAEYAELFELLDMLVFIQVPCIQSVYKWRLEQEIKTISKEKKQLDKTAYFSAKEKINNFVPYFERITQHNLSVMPLLCDVYIQLDLDHTVTQLIIKDDSG
ncbi:P-loop NTPase fold protein [Teredinibacter sp. KSP-S5-2]|uniref:P-loop NTPase fold protein n=1 Tax=Teredinibacter sp. KSP-S5-2 TaxID=3034506 RepID=UPI0029351820|nr:P-loop NTPase fold protein [Teredinibacter sp. KSP-S5-2]WNO08350.1 phosphoribulokinase [Teredinibacter sp. KSP-S5-2]